MAVPRWQEPMTLTIPAQPKYGFWTRVIDFVEAGSWVKIVVEDVRSKPQQWSYARDRKCTADGDATGVLNAAACLVPAASPGALIAKVGGSCAGRVDDGKAFVVGSFCQIPVDAQTCGALYLTINFDPLRPTERDGALEVQVWVGTSGS